MIFIHLYSGKDSFKTLLVKIRAKNPSPVHPRGVLGLATVRLACIPVIAQKTKDLDENPKLTQKVETVK